MAGRDVNFAVVPQRLQDLALLGDDWGLAEEVRDELPRVAAYGQDRLADLLRFLRCGYGGNGTG